MPVYDQTNAEVLVYTFKEGLLSAAAHDLKIRVGRFRIAVDDDGAGVEASFDAASLEVVCARKDGEDAPQALPRAFFGEIKKNIERDVLVPRKFPQVTFAATSVGAAEIVGTLTLHGVARTVHIARSDDERAWVGRARLDQRDFGIKPFSAMLGTLKVRPEVEVEVRLRR